ncbi:unnamed protein product [Citrullus colocynthis]|uniref:Uncharacterized protein n=1 Tax=Citrullus colocynthis TaxID=252529 RepID=A0ABP0Z5E9_9ROSI
MKWGGKSREHGCVEECGPTGVGMLWTTGCKWPWAAGGWWATGLADGIWLAQLIRARRKTEKGVTGWGWEK